LTSGQRKKRHGAFKRARLSSRIYQREISCKCIFIITGGAVSGCARVAEAARSPRGARILGVLTALLGGLAVGAVWCALVMFSGRDLLVFAPLCAVAIAWVLRAHTFAGSRGGAAIAAVLTVVACAYSLYLQAAAHIAGLLGISLRVALPRIGPGMASTIAWYELGPIEITVLVLSPLLAAWLVVRKARAEG